MKFQFGSLLASSNNGQSSSKQTSQEVFDNKGRRRFHGAFTGGFSAGFYNTVASEDGVEWQPSAFKSSRSNKSHAVYISPIQFMDDEDMNDFGIAPLKLVTQSKFNSIDQDKSLSGSLRNIFYDTTQTRNEVRVDIIAKKLGWCKLAKSSNLASSNKSKDDFTARDFRPETLFCDEDCSRPKLLGLDQKMIFAKRSNSCNTDKHSVDMDQLYESDEYDYYIKPSSALQNTMSYFNYKDTNCFVKSKSFSNFMLLKCFELEAPVKYSPTSLQKKTKLVTPSQQNIKKHVVNEEPNFGDREAEFFVPSQQTKIATEETNINCERLTSEWIPNAILSKSFNVAVKLNLHATQTHTRKSMLNSDKSHKCFTGTKISNKKVSHVINNEIQRDAQFQQSFMKPLLLRAQRDFFKLIFSNSSVRYAAEKKEIKSFEKVQISKCDMKDEAKPIVLNNPCDNDFMYGPQLPKNKNQNTTIKFEAENSLFDLQSFNQKKKKYQVIEKWVEKNDDRSKRKSKSKKIKKKKKK